MSSYKKKPKEVAIDLLTDPLKKLNEAAHVLVIIWRKFLVSEKTTPSVWQHLMSKHIVKLKRARPMTAQDIGTERGNLSKTYIERDSMTLDALVKGVKFLGFGKVEIIVRGHRPDGTVVEHSAIIDDERELFTLTPPPEGTPEDTPDDTNQPK